MSDPFMGRLYDVLVSNAPEVWDEMAYCHGKGGMCLPGTCTTALFPVLKIFKRNTQPRLRCPDEHISPGALIHFWQFEKKCRHRWDFLTDMQRR